MVHEEGKSNAEAYARYRRYIGERNERGGPRERLSDRGLVVVVLIGLWRGRYYQRKDAIEHWPFDEFRPHRRDRYARDILIARHRTQNMGYGLPPDFAKEEILSALEIARLNLLDVKTLDEIPSYGPSLNHLWAQAKRLGYSTAEAANFIYDWSYSTPAAWARDDEQQRNKLPLIDPVVTDHLAKTAAWESTGDLYVPWETKVEGHTWQVLVNDFPDEYMYSLRVDGGLVGDFHDWPQNWDRGEPKPAKRKTPERAPVVVDGNKLVARYQAGECESVWRDLMALGPDVRTPQYEEPARAIAKETVHRARQNFELIVARLRTLDYQFTFDPLEDDRFRLVPLPEMLADMVECEKAGLLMPFSLQEVAEKIWVKLLGAHPLVCPPGHVALADPVIIGVDPDFDILLGAWGEGDPEDLSSEVFQIDVCASPASKAQFVNQEQVRNYYAVQLPDPSADFVLVGEPERRTLVQYLRWSFQWGGFPGWEKQKRRPEKELAFLTEGLLPI